LDVLGGDTSCLTVDRELLNSVSQVEIAQTTKDKHATWFARNLRWRNSQKELRFFQITKMTKDIGERAIDLLKWAFVNGRLEDSPIFNETRQLLSEADLKKMQKLLSEKFYFYDGNHPGVIYYADTNYWNWLLKEGGFPCNFNQPITVEINQYQPVKVGDTTELWQILER
jgi:hypothetical protein